MDSDKARIWVPGDSLNDDIEENLATTPTLGNSNDNIINNEAIDTNSERLTIKNKIKIFGILSILFTLNLINYMDRFTVSGNDVFFFNLNHDNDDLNAFMSLFSFYGHFDYLFKWLFEKKKSKQKKKRG